MGNLWLAEGERRGRRSGRQPTHAPRASNPLDLRNPAPKLHLFSPSRFWSAAHAVFELLLGRESYARKKRNVEPNAEM